MRNVKNRIILGIGIFIILLALAGTGSAKSAYSAAGADCSYCHKSIVDGDYSLTTHGSYFRAVHKFNGLTVPNNASSCLTCHPDLSSFLPLTSVGSSYNKTHRYNATTLASQMLPEPGCANCHVNAIGNNFNFLTGTPTYLTSSVCQDCHKPKYDNWSNTLHRVMLTPKDKAQAMGIPEPEVGWAGISYVIVTKFQFAYINTTGYFLSKNDEYDTEKQTFVNSSHAGGAYGTCGRCHTTGWDTSSKILPGFGGTFSEPGIACERCHKPAGNGHQVVVNYSGNLCTECHTGGNHGTGWENGEHAPPPYENGTSCMFCHSSFDQYKNQGATIANATGVSCGVCHNIHDMTDSKYAATFSQSTFNATTWSEVANAKLAFFNATASIAAGTDVFDDLSSINLLYPGIDSSRKDASYGTAPINVTGKADSTKLCSMCHYRHGIAHMSGVNFSHANGAAECVDCHMEGANAKVGKGMMKNHDNKVDSGRSCGGVKCHGTSATSDPLVANGSASMQTRFNEWGASLHNDQQVGGFAGPFNNTTGIGKSRPNSCNVCKSPINWNPATDYNSTNVPNLVNVPITEENFHGIRCDICHPLHDMGNWFEETFAIYGAEKSIGLYEKVKVGTRYKGTYKLVKDSTELCGSCHSNDHPRLKAIGSYAEPGWPIDQANPNSVHGFPAAELFVGSWKQTGLLEFECISCHLATTPSIVDNVSIPSAQRSRGHSFQPNATLLQLNTACSSCHVNGSKLGTVSNSIEEVQVKAHNKYNATNLIVTAALNNIKAYAGEKNTSRTLIAQAYWNVRLVSSDASWGVHNPAKVNQLLDDAVRLANQSIAALPSNVSAMGDTAGLYSTSTGTFFLRNNNSAGPADTTFQFGPAGSSDFVPLTGDWEADGSTEVGLYQNSTGTFFLRNNNSAGPADITFQFGPAGSGDFVPLSGDWDNDGINEAGLYQKSTGIFYLKNSSSPGPADITFQFGPAGSSDFVPITGDWDVDGTTEVGLYQMSTGTFYLKNSFSPGPADTTFQFGPAGSSDFVPITGDWEADGTTEVGLYQTSTGVFYQKNTFSPGAADNTFQYGPIGGVTPLSGNWNGK
jgi:formate-dependent nitrite reductase cytochrome c552 subunit